MSESDERGEFLGRVNAHVDEHADEYVARLAECVALDGVSADASKRGRVIETMHWARDWIERLGGSVRMVDLGEQTMASGAVVPLPPVILAHFHVSDAKPTLVVYGHLDVQPAAREDGWDTEPFVLTEVDGKLFGRGSTDDKGPVLSWLWVVEAYRALGRELPVNLKMVLEGMEESGSVGLAEVVRREGAEGGFLAGVDYVAISDNYWLGRRKPCLTHGLRGIAYFFLTVTSSTKDLHSGVHGGCARECMVDLVHLLATLVRPDGSITVPGIADSVRAMEEGEAERLAAVDFDPVGYREEAGQVGELLHASKADLLAHRWRLPSLSIHGVEGAFSEPGCKTVLPRRVVGKFSLRLVPDMTVDEVVAKVTAHLEEQFARLGSSNRMSVECEHGGEPWLCSVDSRNYRAARAATVRVHGIEPDLTREGGSIPITLEFQNATGKEVLLLPVGACDDGAHSQNEKFDRVNYLNAVKLMAAYVEELAALHAAEEAV